MSGASILLLPIYMAELLYAMLAKTILYGTVPIWRSHQFLYGRVTFRWGGLIGTLSQHQHEIQNCERLLCIASCRRKGARILYSPF